MSQLVYTETELCAEHEYARPQIEAGYRLHGGFAADGSYLSPRTLVRWPAVRAWQAELQRRGWPLIDATTKLLQRSNYPTFEQQKLLLDWSFGETLWNSLTITGVIEARGQRLAQFPVPDFGAIIAEDISETTTGHLHKGLFKAHGWDEGGLAAKGEGGHDVMWFAARDLLFGKDAYPMPEVPASIARPELGRLMPQIPLDHEQTILMLMNVLMIEIRAEASFQFSMRIAREPTLFRDRRADAEHAADLIERIRQDEAIHVAYLQTAVSELRSFTFKTADGRSVAGKEFIDPIWNGMVNYHSVTIVDINQQRTREAIAARLLPLPDGERRVATFDALAQRMAA
jgi:hypothetical protein